MGHKIKKTILISMMFLIAAFVSSLLSGVKDILLTPGLGGETYIFIKSSALFASIIFFLIYFALTCLVSQKKIFYIITTFFISFFTIYVFVLHPMKDQLYVDMSDNISKYPDLKYLFVTFSHWYYWLFYTMCELWKNVIISLMLWQFANYTHTISEAKNTYTIFGIFVLFGLLITKFTQGHFYTTNNLSSDLGVQMVSQNVIGISAIAGLVLMIFYYYTDKFILNNSTTSTESRSNLSLTEGIKYIALIGVIVFSSRFSTNLLESIWKQQLKLQYPNMNDYASFLGKYVFYTNIASSVTIVVSLILSLFVIKHLKWITMALLTPLIILVFGSFFFLVILNSKMELIYLSPLITPVVVGAIFPMLGQYMNILFLRPCIEMSYIPLNDGLKTKGKAFIDIIVRNFGGSTIFIMFLSLTSNDIADLTMETVYVFLVTIFLWILATLALNKFVKKRNKEIYPFEVV